MASCRTWLPEALVMHLRWWVFVVFCLALAAAGSAKERAWTTSNGRQVRGEFVRELDGEVTLLVDGKLVTMPLDRLSERDQQAARDLAAGKEVADDSQAAVEPDAGSDSPALDRPAAADRAPPIVKKPMAPVARVWTDAQGRKTTGKFVRVFGAGVVISRAGGPITIPYFSLSEADQQFVKDLLTERGEEELIPTRPPPMASGEGNPSANPGGYSPPALAPAGGGFGPGPGPHGSAAPTHPGSGPGFPGGIGPGGRAPGGMSAPGGTSPSPAGPTNPGGYGPPGGYNPAGESSPSGGYAPDRYDPRPSGGSSFVEEHERRADAAQRQADRMMQESQDRIDQMIERSKPPAYERVPVCSNCQSRLTDAEAQGTRCPRCGARWVYNMYDQSGSSAGSSGGNRSSFGGPLDVFGDAQSKRAVVGAIVAVVALGVVVTVAIGVIAVAMAIASASKAGRKYQ